MTLNEKIQNDISSNKVVLYMKGTPDSPMCGFSAKVSGILHTLGVDFVSENVIDDDELRQAIKDFSNWPTIPQLYVDGEFIGGCDIVTEMYLNGELDAVLKG